MTAQPTREDLVAAVSAAQMTVDEFERSLPSIPTAHRCLADAALADAQAALDAYDARDLLLLRDMLDGLGDGGSMMVVHVGGEVGWLCTVGWPADIVHADPDSAFGAVLGAAQTAAERKDG